MTKPRNAPTIRDDDAIKKNIPVPSHSLFPKSIPIVRKFQISLCVPHLAPRSLLERRTAPLDLNPLGLYLSIFLKLLAASTTR